MYPRNNHGTHGRRLLWDVQRIAKITAGSPDPVAARNVFFMFETAPEVKVKDKNDVLKAQLGIDVVKTPTPTTALAASERATFRNLESRINDYAFTASHRGKSYLSFIERFSPIPTEAKFSTGLKQILKTWEGPVPVLAQLFTTLSLQDARLVADAIKGVAHRFTGDAEDLFRTASGHLAVPAKLTREALTYLADNYPSVLQFDSNCPLVMPNLAEFQPIGGQITVAPLATDVTVGVVDSGIAARSTFIAPMLNGLDDRTPLGHGHRLEHGTFVASRVVYGDTLEEQVGRGVLEPKAKVRDIRIFHVAANGQLVGPSPSDFSKLMQGVVTSNPDIKVFNLSFIFPDQFVTDDQVTFVAGELDALAREHGVLFVVAAGNFPLPSEARPLGPYPSYFSEERTRILGPADLFNGLSVGAVALGHNGASIASRHEPSPFSRRGPAVGGTRKPDVAAHGGNLSLTWGEQAALSTSGIDSASDSLRFAVGTSFAAPLVSSYAAQLLAEYPLTSADMIRALLINSAAPSSSARFSARQMTSHVGHGIPDFGKAFRSLGSRVCYLFQGDLPSQSFQTVKFRVPRIVEMPRPGVKVRIKVTVVFSPPTDRLKGLDYSAVHFYVKLRKVNGSGILTDVPHTPSEDAPEDCRDKFFPVVCFSKEFVSGFQGGDWEVELRMSTRWSVGVQFHQPYAMVVTMEDPGGTLDLYTAIQNEVPNVYQEAETVVVKPDQN